MASRIQVRRGTASEWLDLDPVLEQGEPGLETDTRRRKIGDGVAEWSALPYVYDAAVAATALAGKVDTSDPRLSDARTPVAHTHPATGISDSTATGRSVLTAADAPAARSAIGAGTSSLVLGTAAGTAAAGNDSRLSDARTPVAHKHPVGDVTATGTASSSTFLRGDGTWANPLGTGSAFTRTASQLRANATQPVPSKTWTAVTLQLEDIDAEGRHDPATKPSRFTAALAGAYLVQGVVRWQAIDSVFQHRRGRIAKGLSGASTAALVPGTEAGYGLETTDEHTLPTGTALVQLAVGDWVQLEAYQGTGADVILAGDATNGSSLCVFLYSV